MFRKDSYCSSGYCYIRTAVSPVRWPCFLTVAQGLGETSIFWDLCPVSNFKMVEEDISYCLGLVCPKVLPWTWETILIQACVTVGGCWSPLSTRHLFVKWKYQELSRHQHGKHMLSVKGGCMQQGLARWALWGSSVTPSTERCSVHITVHKKLTGTSRPIHSKWGTENCSSGSQHI